ncbi:hypothetical protein [Frigoriglobus tundricola]|uniref:Uncharacterized protein n=1 Tax=Frigoriglobus tundricola TaxID=2774151 RepID=A0A6M5YZX0_9BACT|nr:hypothetical protein [Frigoriglobus tundricola]QJW98751.1 hypothetical protein FTUN_6346 [Frigoriglobus tundricola]
MVSRESLTELFFRTFPDEFWKDALTDLLTCYKEADRFIRSRDLALDKQFADWLHPYPRRGLIQSRLLKVVGRYSRRGINAKVESAKRGGGPYVIFEAGRFRLTESMINRVEELPRIACFRKQESAYNRSLFDEDDAADEGKTYYGVLAHLPHHKKDEPAAVRVKFPNDDYKGAFHVIDLKAKYKSVFEEKLVPEEKIQDPKIKLRKPKNEPKNPDGETT